METSVTLQLIFNTDTGKTYTMTIDHPKQPYDSLAIKDCVDSIVSSGIFISKNGSLVSVKEVNFITKNVEPVVLA